MNPQTEIVYPVCDGEPMADSGFNAERMHRTTSALREAMWRRGVRACIDYDRFVYPVEGHPEIRNAPDVFFAPGCEPGPRSTFKYWEEPAAVTWACEFLSLPRNESLDSAPIQRRADFYREHLRTPELLLYEPLEVGFGDFRCRFLRLDPACAMYREAQPGSGGWYRSIELGLSFLPVADGIAFRIPQTGERIDPLVTDDLVRAVQREAARSLELERRLRELEAGSG